jgi:hypothetical protein
MQRLLRQLCQLTPAGLLLRVWLALFALSLVQSLIPHPVTASVTLFGGMVLMFGYSITIVLGLSAHAGKVARSIVRCSALAFVAIALLLWLENTGGPAQGPPTMIEAIVLLFVFAPTFVATHVVGEARRAAGLYKPTDFIGTWLALYMFAFGGAWWAHQQVRAVVHGTPLSRTSATTGSS